MFGSKINSKKIPNLYFKTKKKFALFVFLFKMTEIPAKKNLFSRFQKAQEMTSPLQIVAKKFLKPSVPEIKPGYHVRVHQKIKEGAKERIQVFEGMVIKVSSGSQINQSFTVRKISEKIGVEKTFALHSPLVVKIEVTRAHRVRRAKLYYLRSLSGKALRLPEVELKLTHQNFESAPKAAPAESAAAEPESPEPAPAEPKAEVAEEKPTKVEPEKSAEEPAENKDAEKAEK